MTLAILLLASFGSDAQQQIKILNAFQHYKIQASNDYSKLIFLTRDADKHTKIDKAYLNNWEDAFLVVSEDEIYSIKARYHIFEDDFYMQYNGVQKLIYPHLIQGVVFKNRVFVSRKEMLDSGLKDGYYEVLSTGEKELFKKYIYTYKIDRQGNIKLGSQKENIYIQNSQGLVEKIDLAPNIFFDTFGENQMAIKVYVKENSLNLNKSADLKRLFDYYNRVLVKK